MTSTSRRRAAFTIDAMVLQVARKAGRALTARMITERLAARGECIAPMQTYRSLNRLQSEGMVRRVECLNAYCSDYGSEMVAYCRECHACICLSYPNVIEPLENAASQLCYRLSHSIIEIAGTCSDCAGAQQ